MDSPSVPQVERVLSTEERIELIKVLNGLPLSQLLELEFALKVPDGIMPAPSEAQGIRNRALLQWVEGSSGIGWNKFLQVFNEVTGIVLTCQSQRLELVIEGNIHEADAGLLLRMLQEFQAKANAPSLKISTVRSGSIRIVLQGAPEDLEQLKQFIQSGEIAEIEGRRILGVSAFLSLQMADLIGAYLSGVDLSSANLSGAYLSGVDLSSANLSGAYLSYANLIGANLSGAILSHANLSGAYLSGVDLSSAYLGDADLSGVDLSSAYLSYANLIGANLSGADLSTAEVDLAIFGSNRGLSESDKADLRMRGAIFQDPPGSTVPALV